MPSPKANVTPEILVWAREKAGFALEDVARALNFHPTTLSEWEEGISQPTYAQLEKLAAKYKRTTAVFYMRETTDAFNIVKLKDFRRLDPLRPPDSPECLAVLNSTQEQQAWASATIEEDGVPSLDFVGRYSVKDAVHEVASAIRETLGVSLSEQQRFSSNAVAFRQWRGGCDGAGILNFTFPNVSVNELRGFAIADPYAPLVAVNAKDASGAKIYSLIHEVAHLLIGESGISSTTATKSKDDAERFCEVVAAETLMPMDDFKTRSRGISDYLEASKQIAKLYSVSRSSVLLRFADANRLSRSAAIDMINSIPVRTMPPKEDAKIPRATIAIGRHGRYFSGLAVSAYYDGQIHGGQLTSLLGLSMKHLPKLEGFLKSSGASA